ncbi:GNAT family N-acetyltransferase [Haladaptatus salinisoli]|uniref:GNAT family N-acetyltransferase n=1 Tax=Haladaptatus salinisoli TaxID=2884876 RepID=UPI001D0B2A88|nr:GNAT family N-acetyltransferase [Haladaptatus salinisoli]
MTRIRPATGDDAPKISRLHTESVLAFGPAAYDETQVSAWAAKDEEPDRTPIEDDDHHVAVAEAGENIVGFGHVVPGENEIRAVYVHPEHARRGVGSTVLAHLEGYALGTGSKRLELRASLNAVGFYERRGYRSVRQGTREMEYEGRRVTVPVVAMERSFTP